MKKLTLLLTITIISSCCKQTLTTYDLTTEEKEIIPYTKNSVFKWQTDNGLIIEGEIIDVAEINSFDQNDCEEYYFGGKYADLKTEQYKYSVRVNKKGKEQTDLTITTYNLDNSFTDFPQFNTSFLNFSTITFNNETFTNAVKIDAYYPDKSTRSTLIYSKTHGIEFILFEDGSWYKRVE